MLVFGLNLNMAFAIVDNFKYLGVFFTKTGSFVHNIKEQYNKAVKAMYGVISKCKQHSLSIDCQLDMFDRVIQPILSYGCEVWGFRYQKHFNWKVTYEIL